MENADEPLVALVQAALERTTELTLASREHRDAAASWNSVLQQSRERAQASYAPARAALDNLGERLTRFEQEAGSVFHQTASALEALRQDESAARSRLRQAYAEVPPVLMRLRQMRADAAGEVSEQRSRILETLAAARATAATVESAVAKSAAETGSGVAGALDQLKLARHQLQERAEQTFRQYEAMHASLATQLRELAAQSEATRSETAARLLRLAESLAETGDRVNPVVAERFSVALAAEMRTLAEELGQAVRDLRGVAAHPRKISDTQVLTMMQKLRESLDLLQKVEKVFLLAKAEFC